MEPVVDRNDDRIGGECTVALGNSTRKRFHGYTFLPTCWLLLSRRDDLLHLFPISSLLHSLSLSLSVSVSSHPTIFIFYYYLFVSHSPSFFQQSFKFLFSQLSLGFGSKGKWKGNLISKLVENEGKIYKIQSLLLHPLNDPLVRCISSEEIEGIR